MWAAMNSTGYLCMVIATIKQRDPSGYGKFITCKSYSYVDPKYSMYINRYLYSSFSIEKEVRF